MLTQDTVRPLLLRALARLVAGIGGAPAAAATSLPEAVRAYFRAKAEHGGGAVATALHLSEADLAAFEVALRDVERTERRLAEPAPGPQDGRNALLASVRLVGWLETIGAAGGTALLDGELEALVSADVGAKQIRALELVVRGLVTESYGDQDRLVARLREALSERVVRAWQAKGDPGDVLSGCTFAELASWFVAREEFARYDRLYADSPFLTLCKERRRTVAAFLDDVRRVRNALAHAKRVTNAQLTLLDLYYEELVGPVQTAHDQGATKVNPGVYLDVSKDEVARFAAALREDVGAVRDDLATMRADVLGAIGGVAADATAIRAATTGINRRLVAVGAGVVVLLGAAALLLRQGGTTQVAVDATRASAARTEGVAADAAARAREAAAAAARTEAATTAGAARVEAATEATGRRVEAAADTAATAAQGAKVAAEGATAAAQAAAASTAQVARTLEGLKEGFSTLTKQGGIIPDADRPEAHYHNARVYEERGDTALAMQSYRRYFATPDLPFVDPHLRYQALLKLQQGPGGARETYEAMKQGAKHPIVEFAATLLLEGEARTKALEAYVAAHPDLAPAVYELSREYAVARLGQQYLEDRRLEKVHLERFLALQASGAFLASYLDQGVAAAQVDDAKQRLAAASTLSAETLAHPVRMSATRSNAGWGATFSVADAVKELWWRRGTTGEFRSTGFVPGVQTQGGLPLPMTYVEVPDVVGKVVLQVRYADPRGREHGPYDLELDPDAQLLANAKSMLGMTAGSWVMLRELEPGKVLLYFTQVLSFRIGLAEIRYGLDVDVPDRTWPFHKPDAKDPYAFGDADVLYTEVPAATRFVTVQLTFADGTKSDVHRYAR